MANRKVDPELKRNMMAITLPEWMIRKIKASDNAASRIIEQAILDTTGWKQPKAKTVDFIL